MSATPRAPLTVLAIDDEAGIRHLIQSVLEPEFKVFLAANGQDGLEQTQAVKPHLILLDLRMPQLDGLAVLAKLKANPETNAIPVIIVSAKGDTDSLIEGQRAGAIDHLIKPISIDNLRAVVRRRIMFDTR